MCLFPQRKGEGIPVALSFHLAEICGAYKGECYCCSLLFLLPSKLGGGGWAEPRTVKKIRLHHMEAAQENRHNRISCQAEELPQKSSLSPGRLECCPAYRPGKARSVLGCGSASERMFEGPLHNS